MHPGRFSQLDRLAALQTGRSGEDRSLPQVVASKLKGVPKETKGYSRKAKQ
jgi:hypothetical protein